MHSITICMHLGPLTWCSYSLCVFSADFQRLCAILYHVLASISFLRTAKVRGRWQIQRQRSFLSSRSQTEAPQLYYHLSLQNPLHSMNSHIDCLWQLLCEWTTPCLIFTHPVSSKHSWLNSGSPTAIASGVSLFWRLATSAWWPS